jgi:hypothetical protein
MRPRWTSLLTLSSPAWRGVLTTTRETEALPPLTTFRERAVWAVLCVVWKVIRFPVVALMIVLEPIVRMLLAGFALLMTLTAFLLRLVMPPQAHAPFWTLLAIAVGCMAVLTLYYAILRLLSA